MLTPSTALLTSNAGFPHLTLVQHVLMQNELQSCTPAHTSCSPYHGDREPSTLYRIQVYCLGSETVSKQS